MKRLSLFLFFCCFCLQGFSSVHKYFIRFTDKNGSAYSTGNPSDFLSQRAIQRRLNQNISITLQDIPVNANYIDSVISRGAVLFTKSKWFNGITIQCDSAIINNILSLPFVQSSTKVFRSGGSSSDKFLSDKISMNRLSTGSVPQENYGGSFNQIHQMHGEFLHDLGNRGAGMIIAVLDNGFNPVNQLSVFNDLRNENRIVYTWDFVSNESDVYDDGTHGTMVLSTMTGYMPGYLIGTAPEASYMLLVSEENNAENIIEEYNWDAAAEFADSAGADVITSSLGYTTFDDHSMDHVYADMDGNHCPSSIAADIAFSKGMLVLTSAGNEGDKSWHYMGAPSDGNNVIGVGGVDSLGNHSPFSSYGPSYDGDIKPNVVSQASLCTIATPTGGIAQGNGTSFACPILAGAATCLWQRFPSNSAAEIKFVIERSASQYPAPDNILGYGIPDFRIANYFLSEGKGKTTFEDGIIGIYPNPFTDNYHVRFFSSINQTVDVSMFNSIGQLVYQSNENMKAGLINTIDVNFENSNKSGVYFLRVVGSVGEFGEFVLKM